MSDPLAVLRRVREARPEEPARAEDRARPAGRGRPEEGGRPEQRCDLCTEALGEVHGHLVDLRGRRLMCACRGCFLLFSSEGAGGGHLKAVPDRYLSFARLEVSREHWEALRIPVSVAFFFRNSSLERVAAFYPGPAGATESLLPLETWDALVAGNPVLAGMQPDVEALLVRASRDGADPESFIVPIDACYELVGQLRVLWRGFDGGREANEALDAFFVRVRERASAA